MNAIKLLPGDIVHWFNAIRNMPPESVHRWLDAFWDSQIDSKIWIVDVLNNLVSDRSNIYIFGGWVGLLGNLLLQGASFDIGKIRSIDINPECENFADTLNKPYEMDDWRFKAVTADMTIYLYQTDITPDIIINTSTEHISQEDYNKWWNNLPNGSLVVVQGNDFFDCPEHIRCAGSLEEFKLINNVQKTLFEGCLKTQTFNRWMCVWKHSTIG